MAGKTSRSGRPLKPRNGRGGYEEGEDEELVKLEDTIVRGPDDSDVSLIKFEDTVIENPEESSLKFAEGVNISSTQQNVKEIETEEGKKEQQKANGK